MTAVQSTLNSQKTPNYYKELNIDPTASEQEIWKALGTANQSITAISKISEDRAREKREMIMDARRVLLSPASRKKYDQTLVDEGQISREDLEAKTDEKAEGRAKQSIVLEDESKREIKSEVQEDNGFRFVVTELDMSQKAQLERLLPLVTLIQYQGFVENKQETQEATRVTPRLPLLINPSREATYLGKYLTLPGVIEGMKLPELKIVEGSASVEATPLELKKAA